MQLKWIIKSLLIVFCLYRQCTQIEWKELKKNRTKIERDTEVGITIVLLLQLYAAIFLHSSVCECSLNFFFAAKLCSCEQLNINKTDFNGSIAYAKWKIQIVLYKMQYVCVYMYVRHSHNIHVEYVNWSSNIMMVLNIYTHTVQFHIDVMNPNKQWWIGKRYIVNIEQKKSWNNIIDES